MSHLQFQFDSMAWEGTSAVENMQCRVYVPSLYSYGVLLSCRATTNWTLIMAAITVKLSTQMQILNEGMNKYERSMPITLLYLNKNLHLNSRK